MGRLEAPLRRGRTSRGRQSSRPTKLFNLRSDPKEETDIKDFNPWVISAIDAIVKNFWVDRRPLPADSSGSSRSVRAAKPLTSDGVGESVSRLSRPTPQDGACDRSSDWCRSRPANSGRCDRTGGRRACDPAAPTVRISTARFWRREDVGDLKERLTQPNDRSFDIEHRRQLCREVDAPVGVGAEVLNVVGEQLVVADKRQHVIGRVDRRHEQPDLADRRP